MTEPRSVSEALDVTPAELETHRRIEQALRDGRVVMPFLPDPVPFVRSNALTTEASGALDVERYALNERRAWFVYEAARYAAAAALAPIVPEPWEQRDMVFRTQFIGVIERQSGPNRQASPEDLHEDWVRAYEAMGWVYGPERDTTKRTHPDMVRYDKLGQLERDKDAVFVALCEIGRQWVYDIAQPETAESMHD